MASPLNTLLGQYLPAVEAELRELLASSEAPYRDHYNMLQYSMGWLDDGLRPTRQGSGKRVRPVLCLLACEAAGGDFRQALPAAAGLEALHNFSLLHDDIEDKSDTRRGTPTVWKLWGVPQAINAGDGLYALAHLAFTRLPDRGVPRDVAFAALRLFIQTCIDLTHGQHLDMRFEDRVDVDIDEYITMIQGKTAALIGTSCRLGALLSGVGETTSERYGDFGRHLGIAFQVRDDILGIWGDKDVMGKSTSSDIETRKKTYPVVYGLEHSPALRKLYGNDVITPRQVSDVVRILDELGAKQASEDVAQEHHQKAMEALNQTGSAGQAGQALLELATDLLMRVK